MRQIKRRKPPLPPPKSLSTEEGGSRKLTTDNCGPATGDVAG